MAFLTSATPAIIGRAICRNLLVSLSFHPALSPFPLSIFFEIIEESKMEEITHSSYSKSRLEQERRTDETRGTNPFWKTVGFHLVHLERDRFWLLEKNSRKIFTSTFNLSHSFAPMLGRHCSVGRSSISSRSRGCTSLPGYGRRFRSRDSCVCGRNNVRNV